MSAAVTVDTEQVAGNRRDSGVGTLSRVGIGQWAFQFTLDTDSRRVQNVTAVACGTGSSTVQPVEPVPQSTLCSAASRPLYRCTQRTPVTSRWQPVTSGALQCLLYCRYRRLHNDSTVYRVNVTVP